MSQIRGQPLTRSARVSGHPKGRAGMPDRVRRGSHDPAGMPDRRSPALIVGPGFKGICALRAHSEGRRPSVGHSGGVRRPAPNRDEQSELESLIEIEVRAATKRAAAVIHELAV